MLEYNIYNTVLILLLIIYEIKQITQASYSFKKNLGQVFMSNFRTFLGNIFTQHAPDYYNNLQ